MIMSEPKPLPVHGLDAASRRVLLRLCVELGWFGIVAGAPLMAGIASVADAAAAFGSYCSFAALLRVFIAARRGERPCAPSLNSWDECLALVAVTTLAYFASRMLT